jgi:hypoxanthine-DNA glycosylase
MSEVSSFPPLVQDEARLLVLGSMPGIASLNARQYYAHPRNAFWHIMESVLGIERSLPYAQRCEALTASGIAVWDVAERCYRPGSLDADIRSDSVVANDIPGLLARFPTIRRVCFNGGAAETLFRRLVLRDLPQEPEVALLRLPSTSPAHAAMSLEEKIARWRTGLDMVRQA